jgi:2-polyprenyl-3-methyl-5-hydroxy-6-metoxy-1,4-benzoquinol methylase
MPAYLSPSRCPVCQSPQQEWFRKHGRQLVYCLRCRLVTVPAGVMVTSDGSSIYESDTNIFFQDGNEQYYLDETNYRSCTLKVRWLQRYLKPGARLLDAGANFGHFLKVAQQVFQAVGFDISPQAVAWSRTNLGVSNQTASIYEPPADLPAPFEAITCWDVIEHLEDPLEALAQLHRLLQPGGYLFLSTPDAGSLVARCLGRHWHYIDPIQHVNLFNEHNLALALRKVGFAMVARRSFGRYYRLQYVCDRVAQLYRGRMVSWATTLGLRLSRRLADPAVYLQLGDVMGVAARRAA